MRKALISISKSLKETGFIYLRGGESKIVVSSKATTEEPLYFELRNEKGDKQEVRVFQYRQIIPLNGFRYFKVGTKGNGDVFLVIDFN